jgi:colicin import membrane protein
VNSPGLWQDIKSNPLALIVAVALHVVIIVLLSMNLMSSEVHVADRVAQKTVKAVLIDAAKLEQQAKKLKLAEKKKQQKILDEKKKAAAKKKQAELKKKKLAEKKAADRKAAAKKAAKKKAAAKKKQAERKKQEVEKQKKLAAEKQRQQKLKREAEKRAAEKKEAERKQKLAAEAERKRKQEEEARRKNAEQELKRKLAEEERLEREAREATAREKVLNTLRAQYVRMIEQKVKRNWLKPAGISTASSCEVYVTQSRLGDVLAVKLSSCQNDAAYQRSIDRAVRRASPLPPPPDPGVFDKEIRFMFKPQN